MLILPTGKSGQSTGFTLLELLVVLAIIGIGAALVIPQLGERDVALLKSETRRAMTVLNYARRSALIQGKTTRAVFYPPPKTEDAPNGKTAKENNELHWISRGPTLKWKTGNDKMDTLPAEKELEENQENFVFTFYPEGGSSGGELILQQADYQARITIHSLTGKAQAEIGDEDKK